MIEIPAKVLEVLVTSATGLGSWPYDDGSGDPFWSGGSNPADYQWRIEMEVTPQNHSSHRTRKPKVYTGMDIHIGDYIADRDTGLCLKIVSIDAKTDTHITCVVEDFMRYNTFRNFGGFGVGIFTLPCSGLTFSLNQESLPVVDPIPPTGVGSSFFPNLMSRFQNIEQNANFLLHKPGHGFEIGDLISADPDTNSFVKSDPQHPYIIGAVSYVQLGPNDFMLNPIQKVVDNYDALLGDVGDVIYADPLNAGEFSLSGTQPVLIKLRNNTQSSVTGTVENPSTPTGGVFEINDVPITLVTGDATEFVDLVNNTTAQHGVVAALIASATTAQTNSSDCVNGEPAFISIGAQASINGVLVTFNTVTTGQATYGADYVLEEDMAADINAANIPNITASASGNLLTISNTAGGSITIANVTADSGGTHFAGPASASGVPLTTAGSSSVRVKLTAVDARAINLYDSNLTPTLDFGLVSVENGTKAAGLYIEQGIRQAVTYVVSNVAARDAINALVGDQVFVQDKGNGEWAHYIYTLSNTWVKVADKDSSETDAQTVEIEITPASPTSGTIHVVSSGSRVTFVTAHVETPFMGGEDLPTISVGDAGNPERLMAADENDLSASGSYSTTPSYTYSGGSDTAITYSFSAAGATSGKVVIAITYT